MTTEKRPRVPAGIAEQIDTLRGQLSFEEYVRNTLARAVGIHWIQRDPDHPKRVRIVDSDGDVCSANLPRRQAEFAVQDLALASNAAETLAALASNLEQADNPGLASDVEAMVDRLNEIIEQLATVSPV